MSPFKEELVKRVKAYHSKCSKEGTTGVGFNTLFSGVCHGNIHHLKGAPLGTNGAYYFKEILREVIKELGIQKFICP